MPTVNIYSSNRNFEPALKSLAAEMRQLIAHELSSNERKLVAADVSIRLLAVDGEAMTAPLEVEITANISQDRVKRSDQICLLLREFMLGKIKEAQDIRVWLILAELGHSWED